HTFYSTPYHSTLNLPTSLVSLLAPRQPRPTLFPYTTLFRSDRRQLPPRPCLQVLVLDAAERHLAPGIDVELAARALALDVQFQVDRKSTRLNSSHQIISYAVFCLNKKNPLDLYQLGHLFKIS